MPADPPTSDLQGLAAHIAASVEDVAAFHREHYRQASALQQTIDRVTEGLGRPSVMLAIFAGLAVWMAATARLTGGRVDQPGFAWLELCGTLGALMISMMIMVTQRRENQLAERRDQLTLQLALLADRKLAKTIALLEEFRRDQPGVSDRVDPESADMAQPADPKAVLSAIEERSRGPS